MAFGTFDLFHKGHESYLKQARKLGDFLIVVVARDINVKKTKGALPSDGERKRVKNIRKSRLADLAVLGNKDDRYQMIRKYRPEVIALGYDQKVDRKELEKKISEFGLIGVKIARLKAYKPHLYKSSKMHKNRGNAD